MFLPDLLAGLHEVFKDIVHDQHICVLQQNILGANISMENLDTAEEATVFEKLWTCLEEG